MGSHVKSLKKQSKTVGLAKLAEALRYEWEREQPRRVLAADPRGAQTNDNREGLNRRR
jgi:hypothetical protein